MEAEQLLHASQHLECARSVQTRDLVEIDTSSLASAISISSSAVEVSAMGKRERSVVLTPATAERSATSRLGRHRSRSQQRGRRRVRRSKRRVHNHEDKSKR
eukprot:6471390-Amphidinium_carterae.1